VVEEEQLRWTRHVALVRMRELERDPAEQCDRSQRSDHTPPESALALAAKAPTTLLAVAATGTTINSSPMVR
jgi:hypothetical protein